MVARYFSIPEAPDYLQSPILYERKPVTLLWSTLTAVARLQWKWFNMTTDQKNNPMNKKAIKRRILMVYGPPGSGKSSSTFSWLKTVCLTCQTTGYWFKCGEKEDSCWLVSCVDGTLKVQKCAAVPNVEDVVTNARIAVFDGVRGETQSKWSELTSELARKGVSVIAVSSEGVRFRPGGANDVQVVDHFVPSWTGDEYFEAVATDDTTTDRDTLWESCYHQFNDGLLPDNQERRKQHIQAKFAIAGHSARFMFNEDNAGAARYVREAAMATKIDNLETAVRQTGSIGAVNTIVARLDGNKNGATPILQATFPALGDLNARGNTRDDFARVAGEIDNANPQPLLLSEYATEEVIKQLPSDVSRLRDIALRLNNKAIEGYAFEEQLKASLQRASQPGVSLVFADPNGQAVNYDVNHFFCCSAGDLLTTLSNHRQPGTWIFIAGRQGAFDALHVRSNTHIRFIQATAGQKHTFYLDIIDLLLKQAATVHTWSHLEFMVLRPETERGHDFRLDTARGGLQQFRRFDGQWWDRRDYRDNVKFAFLQWTNSP